MSRKTEGKQRKIFKVSTKERKQNKIRQNNNKYYLWEILSKNQQKCLGLHCEDIVKRNCTVKEFIVVYVTNLNINIVCHSTALE